MRSDGNRKSCAYETVPITSLSPRNSPSQQSVKIRLIIPESFAAVLICKPPDHIVQGFTTKPI